MDNPGSLRTLAERTRKLFLMQKEMEELDGPLLDSTPLHEAVSRGNIDQVRVILDSSVDLNSRDWYKNTPLHNAIQVAGAGEEHEAIRAMISGSLPKALEASLDQQSDVKATIDKFQSMLPTPQDLRRRRAESQERKSRQADVSAIDPIPSVTDSDIAMIRLLIDSGADIESRNEAGHTPLHVAASSGKWEILLPLLDAGAAVDAHDEHGFTPLMTAASECLPHIVRLLLDHGADANARTLRGGTVLMAAAGGGSRRILEMVLAQGVEVNARSNDGATALLTAIMQGFDDIATDLVAAGAEAGVLEAIAKGEFALADQLSREQTDEPRTPGWGTTLMIWAARTGRPDVIRSLRAHGASVNVQDRRGKTPLQVAGFAGDSDTMQALLDAGASTEPASQDSSFSTLGWAASRGDDKQVALLLQRGADPNGRSDHDTTPLDHAVMHGHHEVARLLLEAGADPNARGIGLSPLTFATFRRDTDMVQLLCEHGATDGGKSTGGEPRVSAEVLPGVRDDAKLLSLLHRSTGTDLHDAVETGEIEKVLALLAPGRDIDTQRGDGRTALRVAIDAKHDDIAALLLDRGANPNIPDVIGRTPLHAAAQNVLHATAQMLLARGANPNAISQQGQTPLLAAALRIDEQGRADMIRLLIESGAHVGTQEAATLGDLPTLRSLLDLRRDPNDQNAGGITPLMMAAATNRLEMIETLLKRGADLDLRDNQGMTALTHAFLRGHGESARLLLEAGADPNGATYQHIDPELGKDFSIRQTPLQAAIGSRNRDMVELALDSGANIHGLGMMGSTALHRAAIYPDDDLDILQILLDRGAQVDTQDWTGHTPLISAAMMGRLGAVKILLDHGANPALKDHSGQTALAWAQSYKPNPEVISLLEHASAKAQ